jgi:hypothetical protein
VGPDRSSYERPKAEGPDKSSFEEYAAVGPSGEDLGGAEHFEAVFEDVEGFRAAMDQNPALRKAIFDHSLTFYKAAESVEFQKSLERAVGDFQKMESQLSRSILYNHKLAKALAADSDAFFKAAFLAKIPELAEMEPDMRKAVLGNKAFQKSVFAKMEGFESEF